MDGASHYLESERLLGAVFAAEDAGDFAVAGDLSERAQIHATLALAAVTALMGYDAAPNPSPEWKAWRDAVRCARDGAS